MVRHFFSLVTVGCLLSSCASTPPPVCVSSGWDGYRLPLDAPVRHKREANETAQKRDPNSGKEKEKDKALADLRPYSPDWWAMRAQIDAEEQRRVTAKLLICRGCLPATEDPFDHTGSTNPPAKK